MTKKRAFCAAILTCFLCTISSGQDIEKKKDQSSMNIYVVSPMTGEKVLPDSKLFTGDISDELIILGTPGEYAPASFVIKAGAQNIEGLKLGISELKGNDKIIPAETIDVRTIKCWYQGGENTFSYQYKKVLIPELLLKDDSLVKVDYDKKENYVKMAAPGQPAQYVWMSWEKEKDLLAQYPEHKDYKKYQAGSDTKELQAVDIPANTNKQFYVLAHIPDNVPAGFYKGQIELLTGSSPAATLQITLRVLPFKLKDPPFISSIYYAPGRNAPDSPRAEIDMKNMVAHGITNPALIRDFNEETFRKEFMLREKCGIPVAGKPLLWIDNSWKGTGIPQNPEDLDKLKVRTEKIVNFCKQYGINDVYCYGVDEVTGDALKKEILGWEVVHNAGGKVWVTGYATHFNTVEHVLDLINYQGYPNSEQIKLWHGAGHKVSSYYNPQAGVENPETYRRNYGLLLWKKNCDMACTYGFIAPMYNNWNDFDHPMYKDNSFVYETKDGLIDTLAWEGYRTGIDDARYMNTLEEMIKNGEKSTDSKIREAAEEAKNWIKDLDVENTDLDNLRLKMIKFMLKLTGAGK